METVRFDLDLAPQLAQEIERAGLDLGAARLRLARLLGQAGISDPGMAGHFDHAVELAMATAADLRWRLDWLARCQPHLPDIVVRPLPDGTVTAELPFMDRAEADRWARGSRLHASIVDALAEVDEPRAARLLDDLESLRSDPMALAGFAGSLGPTGLRDLLDRVRTARGRDPVDTIAGIWHRGTNPSWDDLEARLLAFADGAGGLASFGADDPVAVAFRGGGIQVVTMAELLLRSPYDLAGNWSRGLDMVDQPVLVMGGAIATMQPLGPNLTGGGLLVPRVPDLPGRAFWWDDAQGRLVTREYRAPSTVGLVWQTIDQVATDPWESVQVAASRPRDAARGFLYGAGLGVALAAPLVAGAAVAGGGAAAGGAAASAATSSQLLAVSAAVNLGNVVLEATDTAPCRGSRVVATAGSALFGMGIGGALAEAGRPLLSTATELAAIHDFGISVRC